MEVLAIRFCSVHEKAQPLAKFFDDLGLGRRPIPEHEQADGSFGGAVFPAGRSWVEIWPESSEMPEGIMLQVEVDDADAFAAHAKDNGLEPQGPMDAHGERIYFIEAPTGLQVSFQSKLAED